MFGNIVKVRMPSSTATKHTDGDLAPVGDQDPAEMGLRLVDHDALLAPAQRIRPPVRGMRFDRGSDLADLPYPSGTSRNAMNDTSPTRVTNVAPA